jgi:hypothetical protein
MKRCLLAFPLLWTVSIGSGSLLFACSTGSTGDLMPLGDAGDAGGVGSDGGNLGCIFSLLPPADSIDFGRVDPGSSETKPLIVTNTSSDCAVTMSPLVPQGISASFFSVAVASADFTADYQYTTPIPPGGKVTFSVTFALPQWASPYADEIAYLTLTFTPGGYVNVGLKG